jgi:membrane protease subunit (stomatin/prohibitin family)
MCEHFILSANCFALSHNLESILDKYYFSATGLIVARPGIMSINLRYILNQMAASL